jgi:hypothetical protein
MPADAREVADEMAYRFEGQGHGKAKDELTPVIAALLLAREALEAGWCGCERGPRAGGEIIHHRLAGTPDCLRERALAGISGVLRYTKGEVVE